MLPSRRHLLLTGGLTVALVAQSAAVVATPATAAPAPARPAAQPKAPPLEGTDEAAALSTARSSGRDVRIADRTTETTEYIAHPDGQVTATVSAAPVRTRAADGRWVPVDLTLQAAADGSVHPVAGAVRTTFSGARPTGGDLASVGTGAERLALSWPGTLPAPVLDGNRATYPDVAPGVDLVVTATRTGFEQFVVVRTRAAADRLPRLDLALTGSGLATAEADRAGGMTLRDKSGRRTGSIPAPLMWDAQRTAGSDRPARNRTVAVDRGAGKSGHGHVTLGLRPDRAWLTDPATTFPVTIDPQINALTTGFDTTVREDSTTDLSTTTDLQLGQFAGAPAVAARSFVQWPVSELAGKQVTSATVNFWSTWASSCTPASWEIWTTGAASSATRWDSQPGWLTKEATSTQTKGFSTACDDGWVAIDGTSFFQRAATAGQPTAAMGVRATDETTTAGGKLFRSGNADDTAQVPYAVVTYNSYPSVGTRSTVPASACATGSGRPKINSATPTLAAAVTDPEGSAVSAEFEWYAATGTNKIGSAVTATAASGSTLRTTVPAGVLAGGQNYRWRVRGNDGTATSDWSSFCEFSVDTTIGSAPVVSSTIYPENDWGGEAGTAADFTFDANGITDAAAYEYSLDVQPVNKVVNTTAPGAPATVRITPSTGGWHVVFARTRDAAGNVSELRSYPFKVGSAAVTAPVSGDAIGAKTVIAGEASSSYTSVTYQWRRAGSDTWTEIPAAHVTYAAGGGAVTWPLAVSGGAVPKVNWDMAATLAAVETDGVPREGPVQLRGSFNGAGSDPVKLIFDPDRAAADTTDVGPGSVNLITGNYAISETDVAIAGLAVTRTVNSRKPLGKDPLFGPGWVSGTVAEGGDVPFTKLTVAGSLAQATLPDDTSVGFTRTTSSGTKWESQVGAEQFTLTANSAGTVYTIVDESGTTVTFTRTSTDPAGVYTPATVASAGSGTTTTYSWQKATLGTTDVMRPTRILAPTADGVTCTTLIRGCKALVFTYATTTTATGRAESGWGDYAGRVAKVSYTAWDPDLTTPGMRTVDVAKYTYDDTGRLRAEWDPRLDYTDTAGSHSLRTTYIYDTNGIIASMTPPGQEPWQFTYTTLPTDPGAGRLAKVSRSSAPLGMNTQTVVYQVPVSGTGAPYDLSTGQTRRWGQTEQPTDATAVFSADQVPTGDQPTGVQPDSYERATISYLSANGRVTNVAQPGGYVTTTWYDSFGNVVRALDSGNRARALGASATDSPEAEAQLAAALSETSVYSADGQVVLETFGPEHDVTLPVTGTTVRGREHTRFTYDEGAPASDTPYNLVTRERTSVSYVKAGQTVDDDVRTTTTGYDWTLREPTSSTIDPGGLNLVSRTRYDTAGRVTATTTAAGGSSDTTPATKVNVYYTNAANATYTECGNHAEWAGQLCRSQPGGAAQGTPALLTTTTTYDLYGAVRVATERSGTTVQRTTTTTYDGVGRVSVQGVTAATGKAQDRRRSVYDPATGQLLRTQTLNTAGTVTSEIVRTYDTLGRLVTYRDADGVTSTYTYDLAGRPATANDGKATRTFGYDGANERRGLLTSVDDSQAGRFTAGYDANGSVVSETLPGGLAVTTTVNETGTPAKRSYERPGCGQATCGVYFDAAGFSVHEQQRWGTTTFGSGVYDYDAAGRMTFATATTGGSCTSRKYRFDQSSNRTGLTTYNPATGGACQTTTAAGSRTWTYDNADRVTGGYVYDALGRTTTVPAADSATTSATATTVSYHVNDMVSTVTQNGRTTDYTLDGNRVRSWTDNVSGTAVKATNHYSGDADSPSWTQETSTAYTRVVGGVAGVSGIFTSATNAIDWQITNLHGDVVATVRGAGPGLSATYTYDEYGRSSGTAPARYGYVGGAQRAEDRPGGLLLMGARLYNPATGRFLQVDPVIGGSCNEYEYSCGDPIGKADLDGCLLKCSPSSRNKSWYYIGEDRRNTWGSWKKVYDRFYNSPLYRWAGNLFQVFALIGMYPVSQKKRTGYQRSYWMRCSKRTGGWYYERMTLKDHLYQAQVLFKQYIGWFDRYQTVTSAAHVYKETRTYEWER
ncbi:RHS repeat-associated core domain-containing protein [Actinoplanes sp. N902-109]|uniref:RHS repeat-associated core domain-containing protein n=1 Tax=Actinoplanes sp. (strain N902-109) TaxID=649831 RepID=UPI0012FACBC3|nr:RHS repeat-associated core domain-containing protein [Actinoplanes sp. N902-109]